MAKIFESVQMRKPQYSAFDLSHEKKLSCKMAQLIPVLCEEIVPGDNFKVSTEIMLRFSPLIAPIMHRVNVYIHYFFVPNRIVWTSWEDFITGGDDGLSAPTMPTLTADTGQMDLGSLADYMGIGAANFAAYKAEITALPFRAYQEIYNEFYRDETLTTKIDITVEAQAVLLRTRAWEKDYYTSALPFAQRGVGADVPIQFNPSQAAGASEIYDVVDDPAEKMNVAGDVTADASGKIIGPGTGAGSALGAIDNTSSLQLTINDLRQSSALQRWLEKQARGGYRYIETILSHFGVKSSDARLNRPEYLGGGRQPVVISEVLNTSATATEAQGTIAGHGISVGTANRMRSRFEEHGWLIGIMSVLPRTNYQQGIPRKFLRKDKTDYFWPEFANLGEQEVANQEIYYAGNDTQAENEAVFGYQQRYAEYKYGCSSVHADFKSTLDFWHMGRKFVARPALNAAFVEADPTTRIFAVETGDTLWCQIYNNIQARRPMPYFANPSLK